MKEKLNKIAEQYKSEYSLDTSIDIVKEGVDTYFRRQRNCIFFAINYVKKVYKEKDLRERSGYRNFKNNLIFGLLHEIYHAIDYKNNPDICDKEFEKVNIGLYLEGGEYHHLQPFEKRADDFARKELVKWI